MSGGLPLSIVGIVVLGICIVLPAFGVSIASFVIANDYSTADCMGVLDGSGSGALRAAPLMPLPLWLNVYGGVTLSVVLLFVVLFVIAMVAMCLCDSDAGLIGSTISIAVLATLLILFSLFNLAWNIVGAVSLFRDCMDCYAQPNRPLWNMTLAALIFQWLGFLTGCCSRRYRKKD